MRTLITPSLHNRILRRIYGRSTNWFANNYNILPYHQVRWLAGFGELGNDLVLGVAGDHDIKLNERTILLGGICLDHSGGDYRKLTFQVIADALVVLYSAVLLDTKCVIVIPDQEEILCNGDQDSQAWKKVGSYVEALILSLSKILNNEDVVIARTSNSKIDDTIKCLYAQHQEAFNIEILQNLYRVNYFGEKRHLDEERVSSLTRNLVTTTPIFVSEILNKKFDALIVSANLQQIRVFQRARRLYADIYGQGDGENTEMAQIVFSPTPSLSGKERMSRASSENKVYVTTTEKEFRKRLCGSHHNSKGYWKFLLGFESLHTFPYKLIPVKFIFEILKSLNAAY